MIENQSPRRPVHRPRWLQILVLLVALLALLVLAWDWNWLKPMVEHRASSAIGRQVTIGHFDVKLSWHPRLVFDQVAVANPPDFGDAAMATADRITLRLDGRRLFHRDIKLDELILDRPLADLRSNVAGISNWKFVLENPSDPSTPAPEISALIINEGAVHLLDATRKSDVKVQIRTENPSDGGETKFLASIAGTHNGQPIEGRFIGGSALTLRDAQHPYPINLKLTNGNTHVSAVGTMLQPLTFGDADVTLEMSGDDLADLYALTLVPLPRTAKYQLKGKLDYDATARAVRFTRFTGTIGESDLAGDVAVTLARSGRREVNAKLSSNRVVLADLGGLIGATPGKSEAPSQTPQLRAEHAQSVAEAKLLPDQPLSLPKLRSADMHVHFTGTHIQGKSMPLDNMVAQLDIVDGRIGLKPLSFQVGKGQIVLNLALDAQKDVIRAAGDIDFRQIDLAHIMEKMTIFKGAGTVAGKARIDATGNSVAQMLGHGDGEMQLFITGGDLSAVLVDLTGLDFGNALLSALGLPSRATLRCAVADYELKQGMLGTRLLLIDTTEANIIGEGSINLRDETVDYKIKTEPKQASIGSFKGPIDIDGPLRKPRIHPNLAGLAVRGGSAAILGVLLGPLAALLPTIQLGLGEDNNCNKMIESARAAAAQTHAEGKADVTKKHAPPAEKPKIPEQNKTSVPVVPSK
jgi:uncharacterized protein involved in outer membrane biogenesis